MTIFEKKKFSIGMYFSDTYFWPATSTFGKGGAKEKLAKVVTIRSLEVEHSNFLASIMILENSFGQIE